MRIFSKKKWPKRVMAIIMALLMVISFIPTSALVVRAQTEEHPNAVTITVKDKNGAVEGATVSYIVKAKDDTESGFTSQSDSKETDSNGTVEILNSDAYVEGLTLTATVTKEGYQTGTLEKDITSNTDDFVVTLSETETPDTPELPEIEGVAIEVLNSVYTRKNQELVKVTTTTQDTSTKYSTDGTIWSDIVPIQQNAGEYDVYVQVSKEGYKTYTSGKLTAKIAKADITGIDITENTLTYVEGQNQQLVSMTGEFAEEDSVKWYVNGEPTSDNEIPTALAVGTYEVKLVVTRGENYNDFTKTVTSTISNAQLDLGNLSVEGLESVYDRTAKNAVIVKDQGDYTLMYQLDDGDQLPDETAWSKDIPKVTDAGSYIVWVKATKQYYDDKNVTVKPAMSAATPYNVYVAKADQSFSFDNYKDQELTVELTSDEMDNGKTYDFSATDTDKKANGTITYAIELAAEDAGIASIDESGTLTVKDAGTITVKATLSGNDNYNSCTISYKLTVLGKSGAEGAWILVPSALIEYTLGAKDGVPANKAVKKKSNDRGKITYEIENAEDYGLKIDSNGNITVKDYAKAVSAVEANNGQLEVKVTANKAEDRRWYGVRYPAGSVDYTLRITMAEIPNAPYKIYAAEDEANELSGPNGNNGWYNTTVVVKPAEEYEIIRSEVLSGANPSFQSSVKFGEIKGEEAFDQGEAERSVYLRNTSTGEITKKIILSVKKLDNVKPYNLNIDFPDVEEKDGVKYYGDEVTVTFTAYDETSGVDHFQWKYTREAGASESNLEKDEGMVTAVEDESDTAHKKYIGTLTLPEEEAEQLRGNLQITAVDKAGNESISYTDNGVFVIDTIAPSQKVEYTLKDGEGNEQTVGEKHYFSNDVVFTFKITEANFYAEDVDITVSKNGTSEKIENLSWEDTNTADEHQTTVTLDEDADYTVSMAYTDRSDNVMTSFTSEMIVVDKTKPVVEFSYNDYTDVDAPQSATVTITEHNFRAEDICLETVAKDISGTIVNTNDLQKYLRDYAWTNEANDVHKAVISEQFVDAVYELTFNYKDLALNAADELKPASFIVDRTAPDTADMSISYSEPVLEKLISAITFGYYKPNVTVTFTAYDKTSGVDYVTWSYQKETGSSEVNVEKYDEASIKTVQDAEDKTKFTASVTLPKEEAEQLRGNISFTATDKYNNKSNKVTDTDHVLVVDTIAPTMEAEYSVAANSFDGKDYYNQNLTVTFKVTEANFYKEDVKVKVKKNDGSAEIITPEWTDASTDLHIGTITIEAASNHANDGDYIFTVEYKDRSSNEMTTYTSNTKVIDTTKPVINVKYANENPVNTLTDAENHQRKYFASTQTATVTITEHNFNAADARYRIAAKDVAGNELTGGAYYTASSWTRNGDDNILTITYPGDANYTFDIEYTDLAKLQADPYATNYFTVDKTKPANLNVSYSTSLLDTVLSAVTFGFYNAKVTVTMSATDNISGIHSMKYSYVKSDGVSGVNAELTDNVLDASAIVASNGGATGTARFEIPRDTLAANNQFNGTVNFTATDRAGNESDYLRDTRRIVVDNIAPTAEVTYNAPVQAENGISYYDGDISATVTIQEANFYTEDVNINVTKDGTAVPVNTSWSDDSTDVHVGTFTLSEDGDYFVSITYSDKSTNVMQEYTSEQMTIDTDITEPVITVNGEEADGKAFKEEVIPAVSFEDENFATCEVKMYRTSYADKNVDVTDKFVTGHISLNENGGSGEFDTFDKIAENDGIYTISATLQDKAGHEIEKSITFTVNRYGSVYEYSDYLVSLIKDGGAYVQNVNDDLIITEYNADRLVSNSLNIEISRDGKPLEETKFSVSPEINETVTTGSSGWYQYTYTIAKENFETDGIYKIAVSSKDATGNSPENNNYEDKDILFRVDSTAPEITSISGLENPVVNATEQTVKYSVYDTIGLDSVAIYINDKEVDKITDFTEDANNYSGVFAVDEATRAQKVRIVVTDKAGNVTDTDAADFTSSYVFNNTITVSTNMFVRWYANKPLFYGTIGGTVVLIGAGTGTILFVKRKKIKGEKTE